MNAILQVNDLHASYGNITVLKGLNLEVETGGIVALLGANGAGKTTTLRAICNTDVRITGEIRLAGHRIDKRPTQEIIRRGIAHVPDGRGTFTDLTVEENLRLGAYIQSDKTEIAADIKRVFQYFPRLKERLRQQAGTMSGGEQQMLAISRALMSRPKLLLLDEPSFGLAPLVVQEIFSILRMINQQQEMSMLVVEQNAGLALKLANEAYLIETGRIVMNGPAASFMDNETIRRSYLGY